MIDGFSSIAFSAYTSDDKQSLDICRHATPFFSAELNLQCNQKTNQWIDHLRLHTLKYGNKENIKQWKLQTLKYVNLTSSKKENSCHIIRNQCPRMENYFSIQLANSLFILVNPFASKTQWSIKTSISFWRDYAISWKEKPDSRVAI